MSGGIKPSQTDTAAMHSAGWAGRSPVESSAETFWKRTFDRAHVNIHAVWSLIGHKLLVYVVLFCVWEFSEADSASGMFQNLSLHMQSSLTLNSQYYEAT